MKICCMATRYLKDLKSCTRGCKPRLPPEMKGPFEDDFLCTGQFTAWPCSQMEFI